MELYEIEGFLRGKCLPGDLLIGESNAEYIFRQLKERDALAAENACLEQSIEEIADAFETGTDSALATAVDEAVNLTTPATDGVLKRIQAQGVDKLATFAGKEYQRFAGDKTLQRKWKGIVLLCTDFASQLRKEASNG